MKFYWQIFFALLIAVITFGIIYPTKAKIKNNPLRNVDKFTYQLQDANPDKLVQSPSKMIIMDPSRDGSDDNLYTAQEIKRIKNSGKIVLAYFSIGQAEDYRGYWQNSWRPGTPEWLDYEDPDWEGNYFVKFWNPEWQKIILNRIDTLIENGFDGMYLDRVDAYEYYESARPTAPVEMVKFIGNMRKYVQTKGAKNFLIVPQNGSTLARIDGYLELIDGIGVEDLYFNGDEKQPDEDTLYRINYLKLFKAEGLPVFVTEYVTTEFNKKSAVKQILKDGFIPNITDRDLSQSY